MLEDSAIELEMVSTNALESGLYHGQHLLASAEPLKLNLKDVSSDDGHDEGLLLSMAFVHC
jgi:hypothetical protein